MALGLSAHDNKNHLTKGRTMSSAAETQPNPQNHDTVDDAASNKPSQAEGSAEQADEMLDEQNPSDSLNETD